MTKPTNFEEKIGFEDIFTTVRNNEGKEINNENISINKVGEGSLFTKILPNLRKTQKIVLATVAATALLGTLVFNSFSTSADNISSPEVDRSNISMIEKITQNVGKLGSVIKNSEENQKEKIESIYKHNEQYGVKSVDGYKSTKLLGELKGIKAIDSNVNDVNPESKFVTKKNHEHLNNIGKYELQAGLANNQIANLVARHSFRNGNYYEALMVTGEGYSKTTADNIGSTIYHGINTKFQTKSTMKHLAMGISKNPETIKAYEKLAGVGSASVTKEILANHFVNSPKSLQMSVMIQENFDGSIQTTLGKGNKLNGEKILDGLEEHFRAAVRYTGFKVGGEGFSKYKNFISAIREYSNLSVENKTEEKREKIAESVSFRYTIIIEKNGVKEKIVKEDTRATMLVRAMIKSPQTFGYLINEDVKPIHFESMYKSVTGENKNFDKNDFTMPENISNPEMEIAKLVSQGYKVTFDPKKDYYLESSKDDLEQMAKAWTKKEAEAPKTRYCIGTTTITCGR